MIILLYYYTKEEMWHARFYWTFIRIGYELSNLITNRINAKLNIAVLYPVLYRLEEQNFIEITDTVVENGRARNYYAITPTGIEYVEKTVAELRELTQTFFNVVDQEEVR